MNENITAKEYNRDVWNRIADEGDKYFVSLNDQDIERARNGEINIRVTPIVTVPRQWIGDVSGKRVLCLACGGGQQAPLFAAAGANVTVFDISPQQLLRDQQAAKDHQLVIEVVAGDMADLKSLNSEEFDLVINPCSVCYCPDLQPVWAEIARVLKIGGALITGFINPVHYLFDPVVMEEQQILYANRKIPYSDLDLDNDERQQILGDVRPVEFGHTLTQLIGYQIDAGLKIAGFYEDRWGGEDLLSDHIDVFIATYAIKW